MNRYEESIFKYKTPVRTKLIAYGFVEEGGAFRYRTEICNGQMRLTVKVDRGGGVETSIRDTETDEPYTLYAVEDAAGEFVGSVRAEYLNVLEDVEEKCFFGKAFENMQAAALMNFIRERFSDEPEFLWDDTPHTAVWRRKDTKKWYAILMIVPYKKLNISRDGSVEIIDVRVQPELLDELADGKTYFRGYHMNKKHWLTVCLDGSLSDEKIFRFLADSYDLAKK